MRCNRFQPSLKVLSKAIQSINSYASRRRGFHTVHEGHHSWSVLKHLYQKQLKSANKKFTCLLLNMTDDSQEAFDRYKHIWYDADLKIAVDGSANFLAKRKLLQTADVISGDFDSIDRNLIERLQSPRKASHAKQHDRFLPSNKLDPLTRSPQIVETPSQKETDFTKAIHVAINLRSDMHTFFALYYSDGHRMDHLFGLINTLHLIKKDIFLLNIRSNSISWLLQPGDHAIFKPHGQEMCCLVPFTGPTEVKTQGLLYNVNKHSPMSFGSLISTSNFCQPARDKIIIDTKRELLWSLDLYKEEVR